jgi:excisionase family DNA binding protein
VKRSDARNGGTPMQAPDGLPGSIPCEPGAKRGAAESPHGLWPLHETAAFLGVSKRTIRREVAAGRIRCVRIGRRLLFDPTDVSRFVAARKE